MAMCLGCIEHMVTKTFAIDPLPLNMFFMEEGSEELSKWMGMPCSLHGSDSSGDDGASSQQLKEPKYKSHHPVAFRAASLTYPPLFGRVFSKEVMPRVRMLPERAREILYFCVRRPTNLWLAATMTSWTCPKALAASQLA